MGHFDKDTLNKFQAMCAEGVDFGEGPVYNYAMCLEPDGDVYGIEPGEKCKVGQPISDSQGAALKSKQNKKDAYGARMAKLKAAYLKKTGREMSAKELKAAKQMLDKKSGK